MRRNDLTTMVPAELAIKAAIQQIEVMCADERLTEAVILLSKAFEHVANYVDDQIVIEKNENSPLPPKTETTSDDYMPGSVFSRRRRE